MKKILLSIGLALGITFSSQAATATLTVVPNTMTNMPIALLGQSLKLLSVVITPVTNTLTTSVQFIDTYTNSLVYTNAPYTNIFSFASNYVTLYTNYYGATNSFTNKVLVDTTNTTAISTNNFNIPFQVTAPSGGSSSYPNLLATFVNGLWVTNTSTNSATITITYQQ